MAYKFLQIHETIVLAPATHCNGRQSRPGPSFGWTPTSQHALLGSGQTWSSADSACGWLASPLAAPPILWLQWGWGSSSSNLKSNQLLFQNDEVRCYLACSVRVSNKSTPGIFLIQPATKAKSPHNIPGLGQQRTGYDVQDQAPIVAQPAISKGIYVPLGPIVCLTL